MTNHTSRVHNYISNMIPVIASFDSDGHIKPLYVRINGEAFKVHSSWIKPSFQGTIEFECKVIDREYLKPLNLTYHKQDCVWTIPKSSMIINPNN